MRMLAPRKTELVKLAPRMLTRAFRAGPRPRPRTICHPIRILSIGKVPCTARARVAKNSHGARTATGNSNQTENCPCTQKQKPISKTLTYFSVLDRRFGVPFHGSMVHGVLIGRRRHVKRLSLPVLNKLDRVVKLGARLIQIPITTFDHLGAPYLVR